MPLDLSRDGAVSVRTDDRRGGLVGNRLQSLRVARFDLVAQWGALAVGDGRIAGARSPT
jgi:hypothetical protein